MQKCLCEEKKLTDVVDENKTTICLEEEIIAEMGNLYEDEILISTAYHGF